MPRLINPVGWRVSEQSPESGEAMPLLSLENDKGNRLMISPVDRCLVRVVHSGPDVHDTTLGLKDRDGIRWEKRRAFWSIEADDHAKRATLRCSELHHGKGSLRLEVGFSHSVVIRWFWDNETEEPAGEPFLADFKTAYSYDARTGRMNHLVCRDSYFPLSEHATSANNTHPADTQTREYVYGLGETKGPMMKRGKRYIIEGRDSLGADPEETDPLYKLCPFYTVFNRHLGQWYGLYYNTLSPSVFDFGGEHDFSTGDFRSFSVEHGPLDYYMLLGDGDSPSPSLPGIVSQLARLVTPYSSGPAGEGKDLWQASPTFPPLSQFGYLASSLTLSERHDAQEAVVDYVRETRKHGFAIDSMHLSSGYCQDAKTGHRNYFTWDREKYPDPAALGKALEKDLNCQVIINVKPWLLETHPLYERTASAGAFMRAAPDARPMTKGAMPQDEDRCARLPSENTRTIHWSAQMGETAKGSYFDYSSAQGCREWQQLMREGVLKQNITGIWIDNNEFGTLVDDDEELKGDINLWSLPFLPPEIDGSPEVGERGTTVSQRFGWGRGPISVGAVGRGVLTMGMARATYEALCREQPNVRPVVVTRSFVPGMQAFAHGSWSGDNSTSWLSLKWSTKMTLSVGLSCGPGLYGHDIGGFAGAHSPSPELFVRWCQQSLWHTRFTIHSWKKVSTTLWMYPETMSTLHGIIEHRYRLIPMLYSLYVCHYHRKGWPVLKPLLWHHSSDQVCLTQDEQFLVGSHVLVAPVTTFEARSVTFHLPSLVDGEETPACWFDVQSGRWVKPAHPQGQELTLGGPLDVLPTLVRAGGLIVLGPPCRSHAREHLRDAEHPRHVQLFPHPEGHSRGAFTLIEDDGTSNEATCSGRFTQLQVHFESRDGGVIEVGVDVENAGYRGTWRFSFELPKGDGRNIVPLIKAEDKGKQRIEGQEIIVAVQ